MYKCVNNIDEIQILLIQVNKMINGLLVAMFFIKFTSA